MLRKRSFYLTVIALAVAYIGCDKGLSPPVGQPSIEGAIHFRGKKPAKDSVKYLVLALAPNDPPFRVPDLIQGVIKKTISYVILDYNTSDTSFHYDLLPGHYGYLGVAQQFTDSVFRDWRIVGFAHDARDSARHFDLKLGDQLRGVDIFVNWDSIPRQPFTP